MSPLPDRVTGAELGLPPTAGLGSTATLLQLSSGFCAPCRAARHVLEHVAQESPGVGHIDLDVAHESALAERLAVTRTPTILVLDAEGTVLMRYDRVPRLAEVRAVLETLVA